MFKLKFIFCLSFIYILYSLNSYASWKKLDTKECFLLNNHPILKPNGISTSLIKKSKKSTTISLRRLQIQTGSGKLPPKMLKLIKITFCKTQSLKMLPSCSIKKSSIKMRIKSCQRTHFTPKYNLSNPVLESSQYNSISTNLDPKKTKI